MGRISIKLASTTITDYGGRKGDLIRAVEDAITTWVAKKEFEKKIKVHEQ